MQLVAKKLTDMDPLISYSIPIKGLRDGIHQFDYQIDRSFFDHFENSPIGESDIQLQLTLEKRTGLYILDFSFEGRIASNCDRCLSDIQLPIAGDYRLLVKVSEAAEEGEKEDEDPDVVFITPEAQKLEVAPWAYEFICLSVPMIKTYECEDEDPRPCNEDMLDRLYAAEPQADAEEDNSPPDNPIWDELKKLNTDN